MHDTTLFIDNQRNVDFCKLIQTQKMPILGLMSGTSPMSETTAGRNSKKLNW